MSTDFKDIMSKRTNEELIKIVAIDKYRKKCRMIYLGIFLYVGIGTLSICASYPHDTLWSGDWIVFPILLTFPVSVFSIGYRFAEADILYPVFIIQGIVLLICLGIAYLVCKKNAPLLDKE